MRPYPPQDRQLSAKGRRRFAANCRSIVTKTPDFHDQRRRARRDQLDRGQLDRGQIGNLTRYRAKLIENADMAKLTAILPCRS